MNSIPHILGLIPARGGSKGIKRKNLVDLGGKPLIAWTIEAGLQAKSIQRLVLSSDNEEIMSTARQFGCDVPFVRPASLSLDSTPGIEPALHALEVLEAYDYIVLLQPTSPLRTSEDIDHAVNLCLQSDVSSVVSVSPAQAKVFWTYTIDSHGHMKKLIQDEGKVRRQDLPSIYQLNGAIYVAKTSALRQSKSFLMDDTLPYIMPQKRSIDIDYPEDLHLCRYYLQEQSV